MRTKSKLESSVLKVVQNAEGNPRETSVRRGTGPRTAQGKQRSKRNATKHGIFSNFLLKWESTEEYESLLTRLWESLQPEGELEELLVEQLAILSWRRRRLLLAERAEIETEPVDSVGNILFQTFGMVGTESPIEHGLMRRIQSSGVLEYCLELLSELRRGIERDFDEDRVAAILQQLYGADDENCESKTFVETYMDWCATAKASEEERQQNGYPPPEQCKQIMRDAIDSEINRLELQRTANKSAAADRAELENLRRSIPAAKWLDRLLRYEASLERSFDRTLNQLERWQRMRRGQPVAPRIDLNLSTS